MVLNLSKTHKNGTIPENMAASMPAGPLVYREDGAIDWSNMWDSFCVLAQEVARRIEATCLRHQPTQIHRATVIILL